MNLTYPEDGIIIYCQNNITNCKERLSNAITESSLGAIPSDFSYRNYLKNLSDTIENLHQRITDIEQDLKDMDNECELLSDELCKETDSLIFAEITERDRLIK